MVSNQGLAKFGMWVLATSCVCLVGPGLSQDVSSRDTVKWYGLVDVLEDGRKLRDEFELWTLECEKPISRGKCTLVVTSFVTSGDEAHAFHWVHRAEGVRSLLSGQFKLSMNGRLSRCSGLDLTVELDSTGERIQQIAGRMLAGTKCQSINEYEPDTANHFRKIRPLYNGAVAWNVLERRQRK